MKVQWAAGDGQQYDQAQADELIGHPTVFRLDTAEGKPPLEASGRIVAATVADDQRAIELELELDMTPAPAVAPGQTAIGGGSSLA